MLQFVVLTIFSKFVFLISKRMPFYRLPMMVGARRDCHDDTLGLSGAVAPGHKYWHLWFTLNASSCRFCQTLNFSS